MADQMFNNARGRLRQRIIDGADLIVALLKAAEADDTLSDYDDLGALLAAAGNTEADFTNYGRKTITNANVTVTVDDTNNRLDIDFPDQTWTSAGNGTNNSLVKFLVNIDAVDDASRLPVTHHDFVKTTDGNDLTAELSSSGFYRSS